MTALDVDSGQQATQKQRSAEYYLNEATADGTTRRGFVDAATVLALAVPAGKILKVLTADGTALAGAAAGTYTFEIHLWNNGDAVSAGTLATVSGAQNTMLHAHSEGTRAAPLATLVAGKTWKVGYKNNSGGGRAFAASLHHVRITYVLEDD